MVLRVHLFKKVLKLGLFWRWSLKLLLSFCLFFRPEAVMTFSNTYDSTTTVFHKIGRVVILNRSVFTFLKHFSYNIKPAFCSPHVYKHNKTMLMLFALHWRLQKCSHCLLPPDKKKILAPGLFNLNIGTIGSGPHIQISIPPHPKKCLVCLWDWLSWSKVHQVTIMTWNSAPPTPWFLISIHILLMLRSGAVSKSSQVSLKFHRRRLDHIVYFPYDNFSKPQSWAWLVCVCVRTNSNIWSC